MHADFNSRRNFLTLSAAIATATLTQSSVAATTPASPNAKMGAVCVLGASGMVGNAVVRELLAGGYRVVAVSRDVSKLTTLRDTYRDVGVIETIQGDVSSDELAQKLRTDLLAQFGPPRAIVASLSSRDADGPRRILDTSTDSLRRAFETNFFPHVSAARGLIPALENAGVYIGINGGLADFAGAGMGQLSMTQSALRTLYEVLAQEAWSPRAGRQQAYVRVLGLYGLVDAAGTTPDTQGRLIRGQTVGQRVRDIIRQPGSYPGPALTLKARAYS